MVQAAEATLRRSPLHERHLAAGAKLIDFAGWELPVRYAGIRPEHCAVRERAGVFDVSHMGQIETRGPEALVFLQHLLSNDVRRLAEGGAQYSVLCREDGGVLDDLFSYRLGECTYLTVSNAANHARDLEWFTARARDYDVDVIDRTADFAMLSVQGPGARGLLTGLSDGALPTRLHVGERTLAGASALVCGTGYTGEAGYHLYGNDLMTTRGPIEAGLGWCCAEGTGFIGAEAVARSREPDPAAAETLAGFVIDGPGIARPGNPVDGGGVVTSGSFSPCLERGIGMAYLPADRAAPGTRLRIDVRGRTREAHVVPRPIYRKEP